MSIPRTSIKTLHLPHVCSAGYCSQSPFCLSGSAEGWDTATARPPPAPFWSPCLVGDMQSDSSEKAYGGNTCARGNREPEVGE